MYGMQNVYQMDQSYIGITNFLTTQINICLFVTIRLRDGSNLILFKMVECNLKKQEVYYKLSNLLDNHQILINLLSNKCLD